MAKKEYYAIAFVITTLVFIIGIVVGGAIAKQREDLLSSKLQSDLLETQSFELELTLLQNTDQKDICAYIESRLTDIVKKKVELGRLFDTEGLPPDQASLLESQYVNSLVRFYLLSQLEQSQCSINKPNVLFFFDNSDASREQGSVLDNIVFRLSDENITVFSFNKALQPDQPLISLLYKINNITVLPTIMINGTKYEGFQPRDKVTQIICSSYNVSIC